MAKTAEGLPPWRRFWAMVAIAIAIIMAVLDYSVANIALPSIARDFAVQSSTAVWVVICYQLAVGVSLFPLAALGDRIGYDRIYAGGLVLFTVASLACALSTSFQALVAARIFQGLGASGVMSVNIALLRFIFPSQLLGRGIGYNTLIVALSATAGPTVAASILSIAAWPWLFMINVPLGAVAFAIAVLTFPTTPRAPGSFDVGGVLLSGLSLGSLVIAIDGVGRRDPWPVLLMEFGLGIALMSLFVWHQLGRKAPLLPIDLLRIPVIGLSALTSTCSYVVQGLCYVSLPFYFHNTLGFSQTAVGWAMTPWPLAMAMASPLAGRLSDRYSAGALGTVGLGLLTAGLFSIALMPTGPSWPDVVWRMALCGFGFGLFQVPNSKAIIINAPTTRSGGASALQSGARLFGQVIGASLVAATFGLLPQRGTEAAPVLAIGFAALACAASSLRLRSGGSGSGGSHPSK